MSRTSKKKSRSTRPFRALVIAVVIAVGLLIAAFVASTRGRPTDGNDYGDEYAREADRHYIVGLSAYRQQDWRGAITNFEAALSFEPDHLDAREHLNLARSEDRNQQTLERARSALEAHRAQEAIALATTIPESSVYADQALEIRRRAQTDRSQ